MVLCPDSDKIFVDLFSSIHEKVPSERNIIICFEQSWLLKLNGREY